MNVLIYGNGAMAKVLHSYLRHEVDVAAFTVDDACIADGQDEFCGRPLIPFSKVQDICSPTEHKMIAGMGFVQMNQLRERKYQEARGKGYSFINYVHPSVVKHDDVEIEENCVILDHVCIHPGCRIGRGTFISSNANLGHDCRVGPHNWINSGVTIAGNVTIGQGCFFGVNASVGDNCRLGAMNFIAANTFVGRDTEDEAVYLSDPGQLFRLKSRSFLRFSGMTS